MPCSPACDFCCCLNPVNIITHTSHTHFLDSLIKVSPGCLPLISCHLLAIGSSPGAEMCIALKSPHRIFFETCHVFRPIPFVLNWFITTMCSKLGIFYISLFRIILTEVYPSHVNTRGLWLTLKYLLNLLPLLRFGAVFLWGLDS